MSGLATIAVLAFLLGVRHATDADHVIAVTTILTRHRSMAGAVAIGAAWGVGHTLTILVVGGGIVLLGWAVPVRLELSMELAVAIMLIALGMANLDGLLARLRARFTRAGRHHDWPVRPHRHGDYVHTHAHGPAPADHPHAADHNPVARLDRWLGGLRGYKLLRPVLVGVVHGLAGSAAVALLVLATISGPALSMLYLLVFGLGTILGMMLITMAIALPLLRPRVAAEKLTARLRAAAGVLSLGFGLFLVYDIGLVRGLFTLP